MDAKEEFGNSTSKEFNAEDDADLKIILLGDSAVGKSKLIERYLMNEYNPRQLKSFNRMHPSYYYRAHCCLLLFDVTRKLTYQHLADWYKELREYCENIPVVLVANKIDVDYKVTRKEFKFATKHNLPFFFVSAADGTNVVQVFESAIREAKRFKESGGDVLSEMLDFLQDKETPPQRDTNAEDGKDDK
eukprot:GSChrysophyteH1.ASY1.ANO1.2514.1 assembled CDS